MPTPDNCVSTVISVSFARFPSNRLRKKVMGERSSPTDKEITKKDNFQNPWGFFETVTWFVQQPPKLSKFIKEYETKTRSEFSGVSGVFCACRKFVIVFFFFSFSVFSFFHRQQLNKQTNKKIKCLLHLYIYIYV